MSLDDETVVAVVGLGYVGLPLAVEFGKKFKTVGFDLSEAKIGAYICGIDPTGEVASEELNCALREGGLEPTNNPARLAIADFIIIAVPTPVDSAHIPDFGPLVSASLIVGQQMKRGATVIYESTVYPGATEEICIPVLEKNSHFHWKTDFNVGYSPERINPGDKKHTLTNVVKVVCGDTLETLERVAALYGSIISAGVYKAGSIKVGEAAKVIENTQRDLNIALMNELAIIFDRIGIDTTEVIEAAGTKWNFLKFRPGLVGGHCIGVDPYYLTHKAEMLGYHPQVILAGRRINDGMAEYIAGKVIKQLILNQVTVGGAKIVFLGLAFKENCADIRNSKAADLVRELSGYGCDVHVHDPLAQPQDALREYGISLRTWESLPVDADAIIVAVAHAQYLSMPITEIAGRAKVGAVFADVKAAFDPKVLSECGDLKVWRL